MKDLMVDIETMGKSIGCKVMSIGACKFDIKTGEIGETFHQEINLASCPGFYDDSTVIWWLGQSDEARSKFANNERAASAMSVLADFMNFVDGNSKVWGNGATFDNSILINLANQLNIPVKWKFWNDRDVRTMVDMGQVVGFDPKKDMPFIGVKHDALADAVHQAKYVSAIYSKLTNQ